MKSFVLCSLLLALTSLFFGVVFSQSPNRAFPQMYEISTRPWLYLLSQKYNRNIARLQDIPDSEFLTLKQQGIDVVWMMGLWSLGNYGLNFDRTNPQLLQNYAQVLPGYTTADIIGSPYAVTDYTCNPNLGSDTDVATLRKKLNAMGLKLMVDFVPNHSAVDAPWTSSHPEYYVRKVSPPFDPKRFYSNGIAYGWDGYGDSWMDTSQFNYWNMDFRKQQVSTLLKLASMSDYIRCDVAYLCLNDPINRTWGTLLYGLGYTRPSTEFWSDAIQQVKSQYPNVQFLAEVYAPYPQTMQDQGFDFTYEKELFDLLANGNLDNIRNFITSKSLAYTQKGAHYVENHDEQRSPISFGSNQRADAAAMVSMTLPGMKFYFMGQEYGYSSRLDVHLRRATTQNPAPGVNQFYVKLFQILSMDVFHVGTWTYLTATNSNDNWRLLTWKWTNGDDKILCAINYSTESGSGAVVLSDAAPRNGNDTIPVTDLFTGSVYERSARDMRTNGLYVVIDAFSAQFLKY